MIFVSVGTQKKNFNRLFEYLKEIKDEEVIIQCGFNTVEPQNNFKIYKFIPFDELKFYIDKCDVLVTHGGPDNIFYALNKNKKVILVPRMKKYKEHINDHQVYFSNYMKDNKYCDVAFTKEEFLNAIYSKKKYKKYKSNTNKFTKSVEKEINRLLGV